MSRPAALSRLLSACLLAGLAGAVRAEVAAPANPGAVLVAAAAAAAPARLDITPASFKCLTEMTPVRGFFVDNLYGNLEATLAVARNPRGGVYPPGSVVQLVPTEVMVKRETGFSPVTKDWEFFELDVSARGSAIRKRGFVEVNNRFDKNCFACHLQARPEFDFICEQEHGCEELPIPRYVIRSLQVTDPRCKVQDAGPLQRFTSWTVQKLAPN